MTDATDHDAVLRVFDATDRLGTTLIGWKWADGRPTISLDENDEADRLIKKAEERTERAEINSLDHGTIIARVWMDGESVSQVEWEEQYVDAADDSGATGDAE